MRWELFSLENCFRSALFGALSLFLMAQAGCSQKAAPDEAVIKAVDPIIQERKAKDAAFRSDEYSPIPSGTRLAFPGLAYYPINPHLRYSLKLARHPVPQRIRLGTNTGEIRNALRYGYFDFQADGRDCRLQVYRFEEASEQEASLFIPFRDATSGSETYGSGRYIDLMENTSGIYDLDFNRAYNPYCAYNSEYSCPLPPPENTLTVAIRAGEKHPAFSRAVSRARPD